MTFHDKTVFIGFDGLSDGIGAYTARRFARHGAHVVIAGRRADPGEALAASIRSTGATALFIGADLRDIVDMGRAVDNAGPIDILVNHADVFASPLRHASPPPMIGSTAFDNWLEQNFAALFLSCAVVPLMERDRGGKIIHVSTRPTGESGWESTFDYAAKLEEFSKRWSAKWAPKGVSLKSMSLAYNHQTLGPDAYPCSASCSKVDTLPAAPRTADYVAKKIVMLATE